MKKIKCLISIIDDSNTNNILKLIKKYKSFWNIDLVTSGKIGGAYYIYINVSEKDIEAFSKEIFNIANTIDIFLDFIYTDGDLQ
jgi:hypothetical protein